MVNSFSPHIYHFRVFNSHFSVLRRPNEVSWILDLKKQEGTLEMETPLQEEE